MAPLALGVICAAADRIDVASVLNSLTCMVQVLLSTAGDSPVAEASRRNGRLIQHRLPDALRAVNDQLCWRGVYGVSEDALRDMLACRAGSTIGWVTPTSTTLSRFVARNFAKIAQPVPFGDTSRPKQGAKEGYKVLVVPPGGGPKRQGKIVRRTDEEVEVEWAPEVLPE
eukprot:gene9682-46787_t